MGRGLVDRQTGPGQRTRRREDLGSPGTSGQRQWAGWEEKKLGEGEEGSDSGAEPRLRRKGTGLGAARVPEGRCARL